MITNINQLDFSKKYTYADYLTWQFNERVELIRGHIFKMSPAPNMYHQKISGNLYGLIWSFLKGKKCQAFSAPFDVRLPLLPKRIKDNKIDTVIQPDITIICDENKLDQQGCIGVPDLVIEVLSPGNTKREMRDKFNLYENAQIPEYWLVDPEHLFVIVYQLNEEGKYISGAPFTSEMEVNSQIIEGLVIDLTEVF